MHGRDLTKENRNGLILNYSIVASDISQIIVLEDNEKNVSRENTLEMNHIIPFTLYMRIIKDSVSMVEN